jgi:pyruvate ferredoxin oxidoreductase gamma subunit
MVNTPMSVDELRKAVGFDGRAYALNATKIAMDKIGRPVANTSCAGALVKISGLVKLDNLLRVTEEKFGEKLPEKAIIANKEAIKAAYEGVSV